MANINEQQACHPHLINPDYFNPNAQLPYGVSIDCIHHAMNDFSDFLKYINQQLNEKKIARFETILMPANFSSIVGEFISAAIPKYCPKIIKNKYHNGHPDLIPTGVFPKDSVLHANQGIEIKASRYLRGWQGHNPENVWLMIFVFDCNRPTDITPKSFKFLMVLCAHLLKRDWRFSGRSATSRRTITASVTDSGYDKMMANWIYKDL